MPLSGYKTYIVAALLGLLTVAKALGYVDAATYAHFSDQAGWSLSEWRLQTMG